MKPQLLGLAFFLTTSSGIASAGHDGGHYSSYSRSPNFYLFGGLGASEFASDAGDIRYSFGDGSLRDIRVDNQSTAARFGFGMMLSEVVSIELGYASLGELSADARSDGSRVLNNGYAPGPVAIDGDIDGGFFGVRLHTPMSEPASAFVRAGLYGWNMEGRVEDSDRSGSFLIEGSDAYMGVGFMMALSPSAGVSLSYDYYMLEDDSRAFESAADVLSLDLLLAF